jgi:thiamine kinase-like enzyme
MDDAGYFRDKSFKDWIRNIKELEAFINKFYAKYSEFRTKIINEKRFSGLNEYYEAVVISDIKHYKGQ